MSVHFGCTHVAIPSVWIKWGQIAGTTHLPADKEAHAGESSADFLDDQPDQDFDLLGDDALAKLGQKSLGGVYDASSVAVAEKVKGIFYVFNLRKTSYSKPHV